MNIPHRCIRQLVVVALLSCLGINNLAAQVYYRDPHSHAHSTPAIGYTNPYRAESRRHTWRAAGSGIKYLYNARRGRVRQAYNDLRRVSHRTEQAYIYNRLAPTYRYPSNPYQPRRSYRWPPSR
jgi:hypothetical protein